MLKPLIPKGRSPSWIIVAGLLAASPAPAPGAERGSAACHKYSLWRYPWPQHCNSRAEEEHPYQPDFPLPPFRPTFERVLTAFFDMDKATTVQPEWADWAGRLYYVGGTVRPYAGE